MLFKNRRFAAILFDMDGTILSSKKIAERIWGDWAIRQGLDPAVFLPTIHGVRAIDTISNLNLPGIDAHAEAQQICDAEMNDMDGIEAISGVADFINSLPPDRWAVVTSAPRALAVRRILAAGLPMPKVFIASEDVSEGKPSPKCILLAASRLKVAAADCLVFEDAPAGVRAAAASGASVVVVGTTRTDPVLEDFFSVENFDRLGLIFEPNDSKPLSLVMGSGPVRENLVETGRVGK